MNDQQSDSPDNPAGGATWGQRLRALFTPQRAATDEVAEHWQRALRKMLEPLNKQTKVRPGAVDDLLAYVLRGEAEAVLGDSALCDELATRLELQRINYSQLSQPPALYDGFERIDLEQAQRWVRLLNAAAGAMRAHTNELCLADGTRWPGVLLAHACGAAVNGWVNVNVQSQACLSAAAIERLLLAEERDPAVLLLAAFCTPVDGSYGIGNRLQLVTRLSDYPAALNRHIEVLRPHLLPATIEQRLHVLMLLSTADADALAACAAELATLAVSGSKQVRNAATPLLTHTGVAGIAALRALATDGKPEQRQLALRALARLAAADDAELHAWLRETALADKAASVQALVVEWDAERAAPTTEIAALEYARPTLDWSPAAPSVLAALDGLIAQINEAITGHRQWMQRYHGNQGAVPSYTAEDLQQLRAYLGSDAPSASPIRGNRRVAWGYAQEPLQQFCKHTAALRPVDVLRLLYFFDLATDARGELLQPAVDLFNICFHASGRPTLLELALMLDAHGGHGEALLHNYCYSWRARALASDWPAEAVWPFFAHHLDTALHWLTQGGPREYYYDRSLLFSGLGLLPQRPAALNNALFTLALSGGKVDRALAQDAIGEPGEQVVRIIAALSDGKADTRQVAAQWLARLGHQPAVPAIEAALAREKNDLARGALLDALSSLGQSIDHYFDRGTLAANAGKVLAKGLPAALAWLPWETLPALHWADDGEPVALPVVQWLLLQAVKQKSAEPGVMLRQYFSRFSAADREPFGQCLLELWLHEDVRSIPAEQALQQAEQQARSTHQYMQSHPQWYQNDPLFGRSVEELVAAYLPAHQRQPAGSAIASKGLLAVVALCAGGRVAAPVARYLKDWYGTRAAQGKALIVMLAWIEHPSATQLMLSIGSRFRTKSFQQEASAQAEALAERKGWTMEQLADRTIPTAGFDESGVLELDYGPRCFHARLVPPELRAELFNPEGKAVKSLPTPRREDDAERAALAKKTWAAAKKELKEIVALQTTRLYEAMCIGRRWSAEEWTQCMHTHPLMRHLVQRLVWLQLDADGRIEGSFRPLDDGTLSDNDDGSVELPATACVRLAHATLLEADALDAWRTHLDDYAVVPLFDQLGHEPYPLTTEQAAKTAISDCEGYLLEAFALRGRALKLGYTRGAAEDGGWFYSYDKPFPTLGMEAVIEFTGNGLPEENRTVALRKLYFRCRQGERWQYSELPLAEVPPVLLAECWNDLRNLAATGSGFDPDWQKKTEY